MNVKIRKVTIWDPTDPAKILLKFSSGMKARAPRHRALGQWTPMFSQRISVPMNSRNTCMAEAGRPTGRGKNRPKKISASDRRITPARFPFFPSNLNTSYKLPCYLLWWEKYSI